MNKLRICTLFAALALLRTSPALAGGGGASYESYFLHLGDYPSYDTISWSEDVQGITHDDNHWFITQASEILPEYRYLWKIPVGNDLEDDAEPGVNGVQRKHINDYSELVNNGLWHFGDVDYYRGYVISAVEAHAPHPHAMVLFRGDNLQYVGRAALSREGSGGAPGHQSLAWVAVDPDGYLYTSGDDVSTSIYRYRLNWADLPSQPPTLTYSDTIPLLDGGGTTALQFSYIQGGAFSEDGRLLYLVSGFYDDQYANEGISVFDTRTWRRVARSTNGSGHFNYEHTPGYPHYEEPEGVTVWNLDDSSAPYIWGQLHVLMLDNDRYEDVPLDPDDVSIKHYSHTIFVDGGYAGEEHGRYWDPFNTVGEAHNYAWNGARIAIKSGSYPESLTFSKRIRLFAYAGTATIGNEGRISLAPSAAVDLSGSGMLRLR